MANILEDVQQIVADKLNADPQLSACPFLVENRKDIDYEIKNALGRQGIVGLVTTPKARYAGAYMDVGIAWQLDELEIDVVENVTVNRGKKDGYITGQDAAMRLFDVLCPLTGEHEGQFNPVSYEEGEDGSLLVNKSVLKCLVHVAGSQPPFFPDRQGIKMSDGTVIPVGDGFFSPYGYDITTTLRTLGYTVNDVAEIYVFSKLDSTAVYSEYLKAAYIDSSCPAIGRDYWSQPFSGSNLEKVVFKGRTLEQVQAMQYYPWGIRDTSIIHTDPSPVPPPVPPVDPTECSWVISSGVLMSADVEGELELLPDAFGGGQARFITDLSVGSKVTSLGPYFNTHAVNLSSVTIQEGLSCIGEQAFDDCSALISVAVPSSVTEIGEDAFKVGIGLHEDLSSLQLVLMRGKTAEEVSSMANWPWGIPNPEIISAELG